MDQQMSSSGQVAYEAYVESCGGKSIRGEEQPTWDGQAPQIRKHWESAARAVIDSYVADGG